MPSDGLRSEGKGVGGIHLYNSNKPMNYELTLDQLHSVNGAGRETGFRQKMRNAKRSNNLKQLADSGELVKKMKYIPGEMYHIIPGDMY